MSIYTRFIMSHEQTSACLIMIRFRLFYSKVIPSYSLRDIVVEKTSFFFVLERCTMPASSPLVRTIDAHYLSPLNAANVPRLIMVVCRDFSQSITSTSSLFFFLEDYSPNENFDSSTTQAISNIAGKQFSLLFR